MATLDVQKMRQKGKSDQAIAEYAQIKGLKLSEPISQGAPQSPNIKNASALDRLILSFGTGEGRDKYLQEKGIAPENVNKPGFDLGDITSKAGGLVRDVPGAVAGSIGALLGGSVGAPAGPVGAGIGAITGGAALGAAGQAQGEVARQVLGRGLGINKDVGSGARDLTEQAKSGAVFGALNPILNKGTSGLLSKLAEKPARLMKNALRPTPKEAEAYKKEIADIAQQGYAGTLDGMKKQAQDTLKRTKPIVDAALEKVKNVGVGVEDAILDKISGLEKAAVDAIDPAEATTVKNFFSNLSETIAQKTKGTGKLTVGQIDEMLKAMDANIGKAWTTAKQTGTDITPDTEVRMAVAGIFRQVRNSVLDETAKKAMNQRHVASALLTLATRGAEKRSIPGILSSLILPTIGSVGGVQVGTMMGQPLTGALVGGAVGGALKTATSLPVVKTTIGQLSRPLAAGAKAVAGNETAQSILTNLINQGIFNR